MTYNIGDKVILRRFKVNTGGNRVGDLCRKEFFNEEGGEKYTEEVAAEIIGKRGLDIFYVETLKNNINYGKILGIKELKEYSIDIKYDGRNIRSINPEFIFKKVCKKCEWR